MISNVLFKVQKSLDTPRASLSTFLRDVQIDDLHLVSLVTQSGLATSPVQY